VIEVRKIDDDQDTLGLQPEFPRTLNMSEENLQLVYILKSNTLYGYGNKVRLGQCCDCDNVL